MINNQVIQDNVQMLVREWIRQSGKTPTVAEENLIVAGSELVINVLQNLNDIARAANNIDSKGIHTYRGLS